MATFYAKVVIEGTTTPQNVQVQAGSRSEAQRLIEARVGRVKSWRNGPSNYSKPPSWFR